MISIYTYRFHRNDVRFYSKQKKQSVKDKPDEDPISMGKKFFDMRKNEIETLKQNADTHPYPNKFEISCTVQDYVEKYANLSNGELLEDVAERIAGRIMSIRKAGSKLYFLDLQSDGAKVQVKVYEQLYENREKFVAEILKYHRGDIIGVEGSPSRTKSGELSINAKTVFYFS